MKRLSIEAFEDRSTPGGGHAIVLLRGLDQLPTPPVFRLTVIDRAPGASSGRLLSAGDLAPTSVRATEDGIELTVGPDITACPLLLPGTAVEIEVPAANVKGGFLWPAIAPRSRAGSGLNVFRRMMATPAVSYPAPQSTIILPHPYGETVGASLDDEPAAHEIRWQPAGNRDRPPLSRHANGERRPDGRKGGRRVGTAATFWAAVGACVMAIELCILMLAPDRFGGAALTKRTNSPPDYDHSVVLVQEWMRAGRISPRGIPVHGTNPDEALVRAQAALVAAGSPRDTPEGIFWLKHYLSATAGDAVTTRALTQLGSAHAEPSEGQPNYDAARQLWQVAATFGDPLAMCFLSTVHTKGLGVAADAVLGTHWLERAQRMGGCH